MKTHRLFSVFVLSSILFISFLCSLASASDFEKEPHVFDIAQIFSESEKQYLDQFLQQKFEKTYVSITLIVFPDSSIVQANKDEIQKYYESSLIKHFPKNQSFGIGLGERMIVAYFVKENSAYLFCTETIRRWFEQSKGSKAFEQNLFEYTDEELKLFKEKSYFEAFQKMLERYYQKIEEVRPTTLTPLDTGAGPEKVELKRQALIFLSWLLVASFIIGFALSPLYAEHFLSYLICGYLSPLMIYICLYPWRDEKYSHVPISVWAIIMAFCASFGLIGAFFSYTLPKKAKLAVNYWAYVLREKLFNVPRTHIK